LLGGRIQAQTFGTGNAGDIRIRTQRVTTGISSEITATAGLRSRGDAGNIEIIADESFIADGSGGVINGVLGGAGDGGDLVIHTPYLSLRNGGTVSSEVFTLGRGGTLRIFADTVEIIGVSQNGFLSSKISASGLSVTGQPLGDLEIQTEHLFVRDGGVVSTDVIGDGISPAGNLRIQASESIEVTGQSTSFSGLRQEQSLSRITATTRESIGGNITLITPNLNISDQAEVSVSALDEGEAGDINIIGSVVSLDTTAKITAISPSGNGGNINFQLNDLLLLRRGASISTNAGTAQAGGDGGNITINAPFIIAIPEENSDITANAFQGSGGRVSITAQGIFGIEPRPNLTPLSDITASSEQGVSGVVTLNSPDTGFIESGLTELPVVLIDPETLVASSCVVRSQEVGGTFVITGSNLAENPNDTLATVYSTGTVQTISAAPSSGDSQWQPGDPIVEPEAIYRLADGRLVMSRKCE
jgi:large exoprotein involved in heme utilization and adhesion